MLLYLKGRDQMTVAELIEKLKDMPQHLEVRLSTEHSGVPLASVWTDYDQYEYLDAVWLSDLGDR
jgi:hypothetical protein